MSDVSAKVTHAYAYFTNGVKKIVPIKSVQDFCPKNDKDFSCTKKYKVWIDGTSSKDDFLLNAYILLLGSSESDVLNKKDVRRLRFPNKRNMSFTSDSGSCKGRKSATKAAKPMIRNADKKTQPMKSAGDIAKRNQNENTFEKFKKMMASRPDLRDSGACNELPDEDVSDNESTADESTSEELPSTEDMSTEEEISNHETSRFQYNRDPLEGMSRSQSSETLILQSEKRSSTIPRRKVVASSQATPSSRTIPSTRQRPSEIGNSSAARQLPSPRSTSCARVILGSRRRRETAQPVRQAARVQNPDDPHQQIHLTPQRELERRRRRDNDIFIRGRNEVPQDMVYLDANTPITRDAWEVIRHKSDSKFVRDIAVRLWGTEGLAQRCINTTRANRNKRPDDELRRELTPEKYETVKGRGCSSDIPSRLD